MTSKRLNRFCIAKRFSFTPAGVAATVLMTVFAGWLTSQWILRGPVTVGSGVADMRANEVRAFANLERISQAQLLYHDRSPKVINKRSYAAFLVHLWASVDRTGRPVKMGLIPESLAIAMGPSKALDGYYFVDIRERFGKAKTHTSKIDYEREWAMAGLPAVLNKTGRLIFLIDQSGTIFVNTFRYIPTGYPINPTEHGWTRIRNPEELKAHQKTVPYDTANPSPAIH